MTCSVMRNRALVVASAALLGVASAQAQRASPAIQLVPGSSCTPGWRPTFGGEPGTDHYVTALAVYDDGGGPALFAGGPFANAGGLPAERIARWDGSSWSAVGGGVTGGVRPEVRALLVHDDGSGPALYVGGEFTSAGGVAASHIARWDGSSWSALGGGIDGPVSALAVYDDGSGPALYAAGWFTSAGGAAANHIARWDGSSWAALGSGPNDGVSALTVYDDGTGPALHVAGSFRIAGGVPANRIAKWDGSSWTALGSGMIDSEDRIHALAVFDDGSGPALCVGGDFRDAGGLSASGIASWDGSSWAVLGEVEDHQAVRALLVYDDGSGPALYAGGSIELDDGELTLGVARWDGTSWKALGSAAAPSAAALAVYDDGSGPALFAGGSFRSAGGLVASRVARWDGSSWSALGGSGINATVGALAVHDDGRGPALHAALDSMPGLYGDLVARWNGSSWLALGTGTFGSIEALASHDDGSGPALYAGGNFTVADGVQANGIARWDGSSWSALGSELGPGTFVEALAAYDDGTGPALHAGGRFNVAGGVPGNHVARWDGSHWSALGGGMNPEGIVRALAVYDDGTGPALYAAGRFTAAGGSSAKHVARWDGSRWSALGAGLDAPGERGSLSVDALAVYDDGGGPALYAAGRFTIAGGVPVNHVARWDGASWSAVGSGVAGGLHDVPRIHSLAVHDDGAGPALYAGGNFTMAGGVAANHLARWDGSSWAPLGSGVSAAVRALLVFEGPARGAPALVAGGDFGSAPDSGDSYLAVWQGCPDTTPPVLSCPTSVTVADSGPPGEVVTYTVTGTDDRDASPSVVCEPPSGSFFPPGKTLVHCKATDAAGNASTCSFPVVVRPRR